MKKIIFNGLIFKIKKAESGGKYIKACAALCTQGILDFLGNKMNVSCCQFDNCNANAIKSNYFIFNSSKRIQQSTSLNNLTLTLILISLIKHLKVYF